MPAIFFSSLVSAPHFILFYDVLRYATQNLPWNTNTVTHYRTPMQQNAGQNGAILWLQWLPVFHQNMGGMGGPQRIALSGHTAKLCELGCQCPGPAWSGHIRENMMAAQWPRARKGPKLARPIKFFLPCSLVSFQFFFTAANQVETAVL